MCQGLRQQISYIYLHIYNALYLFIHPIIILSSSYHLIIILSSYHPIIILSSNHHLIIISSYHYQYYPNILIIQYLIQAGMGCCDSHLKAQLKEASQQTAQLFDSLSLFNQHLTKQQRQVALNIWHHRFLINLSDYLKQQLTHQINKKITEEVLSFLRQLDQIVADLSLDNQSEKHLLIKFKKVFNQQHKRAALQQNETGLATGLLSKESNSDFVKKKTMSNKTFSSQVSVSQVSKDIEMQIAGTPYSLPRDALQIQQTEQQDSEVSFSSSRKIQKQLQQKLKQNEYLQKQLNYFKSHARRNEQSNGSAKKQQQEQSQRKNKAELKNKLQELQKELRKLQIYIQNLQNDNQELLQQKNAESLDKNILEKKMKELERREENRNRKSFAYVKKDQLQKVNLQKRKFQDVNTIAQVKEEGINESNGSHRSDKIQKDYQIIFNLFPSSKILPDHHHFQSAVGTRTIISEFFTQKIKKTSLVYSYDEITLTHFDRYIQNKENLLILLHLQNDLIIGAFAGQFQEDDLLSQSFLFSIHPKSQPIKATTHHKIKRINLQNNSYINFGNGQLKLKAKTLSLFANVGSFQSIYCWGKKKVPFDKFFGGQSRSCSVKTYEIYQIIFGEMQQTTL